MKGDSEKEAKQKTLEELLQVERLISLGKVVQQSHQNVEPVMQ